MDLPSVKALKHPGLIKEINAASSSMLRGATLFAQDRPSWESN